MRYEKCILLLGLAIFLLSITGAWASDTNDTMIGTEDNSAIELSDDDLMSIEENENTLKENEKTFRDLNYTINGNTDTDIYLNHDYRHSDDDTDFSEGIIIDRDVNIYGNGHTINASNQARIFKISSSNVVFHDITFTNGHADEGGALNGGTAINCTFTANQAKWGGAMLYGSAINCTFTANQANFGGALNSSTAINCTFTANQAEWGGAMLYGSAINCTFTQNNAKHDAGALYDGLAVNCTFTDNQAEECGGAMNDGSAINCTFTGNKAEFIGGAMFYSSAINCTFKDNQAEIGPAMSDCRYLECTGQEWDFYDCSVLILSFESDDFTSTYKSDKEFTVTLKDQDDEIKFINTEIVIYKGDEKVKTYSLLSGESVIFDLAAGTYTAELRITYPNLDPKPRNITLTISRATPKIEVTAGESTYPNVIINVKTDISGEYQIKIGDKTQNISLEANVGQNITFTGLAANKTGYAVNVTNNDIENCTKAVNDTARAIVHKMQVEINLISESIELHSYEKIGNWASVTPADAGNLKFVSSNEDVAFLNNEGWIYAWSKGTATITVSLEENENYTAENKTVTVNVTPKDASVSVENTTVNLKVGERYSINATANPPWYSISYASGNESVAKISSYGIIEALGEGDAIITLSVGDDQLYAKNSTEILVRVSKIPTEIISADVSTVYNADKYLTVTLKDDLGNPISGVGVTVELNGKKTYITDKNGQVKVSTKGLVPKSYGAKITFNGNDNCLKSSKDVKVTVTKAAPKLTAKAKSFKKSAKTKKYSITLKDNRNKALTKKAVAIKIKGKTYKAKTNAKGKATFKIKKLTKKGTYTATVTFKGDNCYKKVTKKVKIRIK